MTDLQKITDYPLDTIYDGVANRLNAFDKFIKNQPEIKKTVKKAIALETEAVSGHLYGIAQFMYKSAMQKLTPNNVQEIESLSKLAHEKLTNLEKLWKMPKIIAGIAVIFGAFQFLSTNSRKLEQ